MSAAERLLGNWDELTGLQQIVELAADPQFIPDRSVAKLLFDAADKAARESAAAAAQAVERASREHKHGPIPAAVTLSVEQVSPTKLEITVHGVPNDPETE